MKRFIRHLKIVCIISTLIAAIYLMLESPNPMFLLSMATAYTGLLLIAVTLLVGPLNLIRNKSNPISTYLRRDIGIWAGIVSIAHMFIGFEIHFGGKYIKFFTRETDSGYQILFNTFGLANYIGLFVSVLCVVLLSISNNVSLKKYGVKNWKNIQRLNYLIFAFVLAHGFLYQSIENRSGEFIFTVIFVMILVLVFQWKGYRIFKTVNR